MHFAERIATDERIKKKKIVNHVKNRQESVRIIDSRLQTNTEVSPVQQLPVRELKKTIF